MRFVYCSCLRTRRIVLTAYVVVPVGATIVTRTRRLHHGRTVTVARVAHARVAHARVAAAVGGAHILTNHHAGTIGKTTEGAERSGLVDAFAYRRYSTKFVEDEEYAKANQLGLWAMQFEYPWDYRKRIRSNQ